jgi:hypothetical protein
MTRYSKVLTILGVALVVAASILASGIPKAAHGDFGRLVKATGGRMHHTPGYPDVYRKMCAERRMLQNFYLGAAGLICLSAGLRRKSRSAEVATVSGK